MQRAVLVGCGGMSNAWFNAAKADGNVKIVGVVDINPAAAEAQAKKYELHDAVIGSDISAVLAKTLPDVLFDVVVPPARHAVVSAGLAAGCHVLSEKPMADTLEEAQDLMARAAAAKRIHAIIQNRRYDPQIRRIRRFLASGEIGDVTSIHADFFIGAHFGGFRDEMKHVLLLDMAIHTFDAARYLAGQDMTAVYAKEWEPKSSWYHQGSSASAIFELGNGGVFTYQGSWCAEGMNTTWESGWRIIGTKGTLLWDGAKDIRAQRPTKREGFISPLTDLEIPPHDPSDRIGGHVGVMADFLAAVRGGPTPETVGYENIKSLAMVFGAIRSAESKQRVELNV